MEDIITGIGFSRDDAEHRSTDKKLSVFGRNDAKRALELFAIIDNYEKLTKAQRRNKNVGVKILNDAKKALKYIKDQRSKDVKRHIEAKEEKISQLTKVQKIQVPELDIENFKTRLTRIELLEKAIDVFPKIPVPKPKTQEEVYVKGHAASLKSILITAGRYLASPKKGVPQQAIALLQKLSVKMTDDILINRLKKSYLVTEDDKRSIMNSLNVIDRLTEHVKNVLGTLINIGWGDNLIRALKVSGVDPFEATIQYGNLLKTGTNIFRGILDPASASDTISKTFSSKKGIDIITYSDKLPRMHTLLADVRSGEGVTKTLKRLFKVADTLDKDGVRAVRIDVRVTDTSRENETSWTFSSRTFKGNDIDIKEELNRWIENVLPYNKDSGEISISMPEVVLYIILPLKGGCKYLVPRKGMQNMSENNDNNCFFDCVGLADRAQELRKKYNVQGLVSLKKAEIIIAGEKLKNKICLDTSKIKVGDITIANNHWFVYNCQVLKTIAKPPKDVKSKEVLNVFYDIEAFNDKLLGIQIPVVYGVKIDGLSNTFHTESFSEIILALLILLKHKKIPKNVRFITFNGSRYDNFLAMNEVLSNGFPFKVTFGTPIFHNGSILKFPMRITYEDNILNADFWDISKHCEGSLAENLYSFKCDTKKGSFDYKKISYLDEMLDEDRIELLEYLYKDVDGLVELFKKKEEIFREVTNREITDFISTSHGSYEVFRSMADVDIISPKSIDDDKYFRAAIYGGKARVYKKYFISSGEDDYLIALDATSLYPSAMALNYYPCGDYEYVNLDKIKDELVFSNLLKKIDDESLLAVMKVEITDKIELPRHHWFPHRTKNGVSFSPITMIGKTVPMTSIQYNDMKPYYKMRPVSMMIFKDKKQIFKDFVNKYFGLRAEHKLLFKKTGELKHDLLQSNYKLVLNASYGKTGQKPITSNQTIKKVGDQFFNCVNDADRNGKLAGVNVVGDYGFCDIENITENSYSKPSYLMAFILAYSKRQMLRTFEKIYINGGEDAIYYVDTDSIYIHQKFAQSLINRGPDCLGTYKSDYGDNCKIIEFIGLAPKIKACKLEWTSQPIHCDEEDPAFLCKKHESKCICNKTGWVENGKSYSYKFTMKGIYKGGVSWESYKKLMNGETVPFYQNQFKRTLFTRGNKNSDPSFTIRVIENQVRNIKVDLSIFDAFDNLNIYTAKNF